VLFYEYLRILQFIFILHSNIFVMNPRLYNFILKRIRFFETLIYSITFFVGLYIRLFLLIPPEHFISSYSYFIKRNWLTLPFHYFQPTINRDMLPQNYEQIEDSLLGIDLDIESQLELLSKFNYNTELEVIPLNKSQEFEP
jgi:hypothetical protein